MHLEMKPQDTDGNHLNESFRKAAPYASFEFLALVFLLIEEIQSEDMPSVLMEEGNFRLLSMRLGRSVLHVFYAYLNE